MPGDVGTDKMQTTEKFVAESRASEIRHRTLFESSGEGFGIIELVTAQAGAPLDFRYLDVNPAFAAHTGLTGVVGKTIREVSPDETEESLLAYDTVRSTGEPTRFERDLVAQGRVLEFYAFLVSDGTASRVAISVTDITKRKQAEELLRRNHDTFFSLIQNAPFGVYVVDAQFRMRQVSTASQKVFSNVHPLIGRDFEEIIRIIWTDPFASEALGYFRHTLATGEPYAAPSTVQTRHDIADVESYDWKIERIVLPDGQFGVVCYFYDNTERQQTENVLRQRTSQFKVLLDEAPLGIYLVDSDFRICQANPIALQVFGNVPGLIGRDFAEVTHILWSPANADDIVRRFRHTLECGEPSIVAELLAERMDRRVTEHYEWQINRIPLQGAGFGVVCYFRDISSRALAQERLRESEARYRNLFNSIDEGFCIMEMIFDEHEQPVDWRFVEVNPSFEKQTGMPDIVGKRIRELLPDHEEYWFAIYGKVALTGEPVRFTNEAKGMDRSWFDLYAFRVGGADSRNVAVIFNNITERTRLQQTTLRQAEALADLHRRKDEFLAMLSHELRSPLAPIANAVHLLRMQATEDPIQQQARGIIERQVAQLTHLVDDLLEVSRISTGRIQIRLEQVAVSGIVTRAVETTRPLLDQRRQGLEVSLPPQPLWLHADAARLEQVVVNLLTNATKYTEERGHIWLTVEQEGDAAVLRVRDTGVGIPPELLPRIFDLFTQAERSLDRSQGGLGIGLSLVQRLVELHGGAVEAHSVLGQGSEFVVRLPLLMASIPQPPTLSAETPQLSTTRCRVLVVDDNSDTAQSLAILLTASHHEVRIAHDGPGALAAALDFQPVVLLLDIGLPGFDGYELAKRIREEPALQDTVLVAMTGYGRASDLQRSRDAGFNHHLVKPVDFAKVLKILTTVRGKMA